MKYEKTLLENKFENNNLVSEHKYDWERHPNFFNAFTNDGIDSINNSNKPCDWLERLSEPYKKEKRDVSLDNSISFDKINNILNIKLNFKELTIYNTPNTLKNILETYKIICNKYETTLHAILDCSKLSLFDSSGVGVFIHLSEHFKKCNRSLAFYGFRGRSYEIAKRLSVYNLFKVYDEYEDAINYLNDFDNNGK